MLANNIVVIDPLFEHLRNLIQEGITNSLNRSIALYGNERDMDKLQQLISKVASHNENKKVLVDLSPLPSLGAQKRFSSLLELNEKIPFIVAVRASMALEQLQLLKNISVLVTDDETGQIIDTNFCGKDSKKTKALFRSYIGEKTIFDIRKQYFEGYLLNVSQEYIRLPPDGSRYIKLHDDTWANQWIDVKAILRKSETALLIAYQMGYALTEGYTKEVNEDVFIVGNNTAYILGLFLNRIFENKELVVIDRLGPFPNFSFLHSNILRQLNRKQVCIVEDVNATGREIDLLTLLALSNNAEVKRSICVFDLECAATRFLNDEENLALCRPSKFLRYKRFPKYLGKRNEA
jgi:hypothetical protein